MKIAVRGGHTELCTGASALINELTEDRKVKDAVVKYLRTLGQDVLDVTPPVNYTSSANKDLAMVLIKLITMELTYLYLFILIKLMTLIMEH